MSHPSHARRHYSIGVRIVGGLLVSMFFMGAAFLLLELGLRISGYGTDSKYLRLVESPDGQRWFRENREFTHRFFPQGMIRRPQSMRIAENKDPDVVRIAILGSSAAMGDPEASFSIARVLECLLSEAYPDLRFEVINAAITAINSHVVVRIAEDIRRLQPDIMIVYEGNNEVIGPFGPTGVLAPVMNSRGAISVFLGFRTFRTVQLLHQLSDRSTDKHQGTPEAWGGMGMFLQHTLDYEDPRLRRVETHFRNNLRAIVRAVEASGARVLLCTVLTNEKDFAPFVSLAASEIEVEVSKQELVSVGDLAMQSGDLEAAIAHYQRALGVDDKGANLHFRLGRALLAAGRNDEAAKSFAEARDRDTLRFRTDSRLNEVIRSVGNQLGDRGKLVDLAKDLAAVCAQGILGDELLYEHVHLNLRGNYLVALRLMDAIQDWIPTAGGVPGDGQLVRIADYAEVRLRLGYTLYEQFLITHELLQRFRAAPFNQQEDSEIRLHQWTERWQSMQSLLESTGQQERMFAHYRHALELRPDDWILQRNFGMALVALERAPEAIPWLQKAQEWIPDDPDLLFALATAYDRNQQTLQSQKIWNFLRNLEPRYPGLPE